MTVPVDFYGAVVALGSVTLLAKVVSVRLGHPRDQSDDGWWLWTAAHLLVLASSTVAILASLWGLSHPAAGSGCAVTAAVGATLALLVLLGDAAAQDMSRFRGDPVARRGPARSSTSRR